MVRSPLGGRLRLAAAIILMVVFAVVARFCPSFDALFARQSERAFVRQVIDGDTVLLDDGRFVRYIGIDTPEMNSTVARTRALAERARELNATLVDGREVRLEFDVEDKDKYGRTLAYVYTGAECVNARLVAEGLARAEFYGDNARRLAEFENLEKEAKARRLGIWEERR